MSGPSGPRIDRRALLLGAGAALLPSTTRAQALGSSAQQSQHSHAAPPPPPASGIGAPLQEPEVRRAVKRRTAHHAARRLQLQEPRRLPPLCAQLRGQRSGPDAARPARRPLRITLINDLPPNRDTIPRDLGIPHHFNTTNFHFHGSHVSPSGIADNVMRSMAPGEISEIAIDIPADHTSGTYWYHPHHHGGADIQIASGMAGAIILDGDFDSVPEIVAATEHTLVLNEVVFDQFGMVERFETLFPETATRFFSVNGQREPTIAMRPGEVQRWRLVHAGYQDDLFLELEGHGLHVIAWDGVALPAIRSMDRLLIAPGQRADVLVQAGAAGSYALRALPYDQGYPSPTGTVARLAVAGDPLPMSLPSRLPPPPIPTIADGEITNRRTLTFSARVPEAEAAADWREFSFLIDGRLFDPDRVDQRVRLGAVEEWTLVNTPPARPHLPHPHQPVPGDPGERPARRPDLARHRRPAPEGEPDVPLAVHRFHRQVHAPLPYDEP
ncbi:MAG: multicopper oxidase family protein [Acetobacteraceae bacterium]